MKRTILKHLAFFALSLFLVSGSALSVCAKGKGDIDYTAVNIDLDGDGTFDMNIDLDGDGKADINVDQDGDGHADLNLDLDGDLISDLNTDIDGDDYPDVNIDSNGDRYPDTNIDSDFNGVVDIMFTEGYNGTFYSDMKEGLVVSTDGDFADFQGLQVDGVTLTEDEYAAIEGGTIVQLFYSYLKTLPAGQHILTFVYPEETASCYFYVAESNTIHSLTSDVTVFMFGLVCVLGLLTVITLIIIWKVVTKDIGKPQ